MKILGVIVAVFYLGLFSFNAASFLFSQDDAAVVKSFKDIVKSVDDYFSTSPVILYSEVNIYSPSGKINYLLKYEKIETSFDVQKTNSLISPYTAYIVLKLKASSNAKFGDIKKAGKKKTTYNWGFQNAEDALKIKEFSLCIDEEYLIPTSTPADILFCSGEIKLLYALQENSWIFKDAVFDKSTQIHDFSAAGALRQKFLENPEWKQVLLGKNK